VTAAIDVPTLATMAELKRELEIWAGCHQHSTLRERYLAQEAAELAVVIGMLLKPGEVSPGLRKEIADFRLVELRKAREKIEDERRRIDDEQKIIETKAIGWVP
jgi:hypothetical protein